MTTELDGILPLLFRREQRALRTVMRGVRRIRFERQLAALEATLDGIRRASEAGIMDAKALRAVEGLNQI